MGDLRFDSSYFGKDRGVVKLALIILGLVACSVLCANWYGTSCFGEGRLGYASGLNFIFLIINIVSFILNLLSFKHGKFEHLYSAIAAILFAVAAGLLIWYLITARYWDTWLIVATVVIVIQFILYLWDFRATKEYQGHLPI
ncbi:unnamed protein product [Bursaphelenchus xylophilus]|uniref:(pine wood nematode) hypothetical protein n=1 Tax=Bursaphelenchus xylophilus TaxID=6326 RepID=A0A1I7RHE9_BURXY|nr:unnamed protein product [Bursaphelenchus xylophilus]CAG9115803.1 unnamed protein product [Bursaphelenchus xylophilus]